MWGVSRSEISTFDNRIIYLLVLRGTNAEEAEAGGVEIEEGEEVFSGREGDEGAGR